MNFAVGIDRRIHLEQVENIDTIWALRCKLGTAVGLDLCLDASFQYARVIC